MRLATFLATRHRACAYVITRISAARVSRTVRDDRVSAMALRPSMTSSASRWRSTALPISAVRGVSISSSVEIVLGDLSARLASQSSTAPGRCRSQTT
jgi:hypothetical protein